MCIRDSPSGGLSATSAGNPDCGGNPSGAWNCPVSGRGGLYRQRHGSERESILRLPDCAGSAGEGNPGEMCIRDRCKPIRILREFTRYRYKLTSCRSSEKNRFQNALTVCNVALDSVVSDIFGKSATSVIDYLLKQPNNSINHEEISSRLLRSLKKKSESCLLYTSRAYAIGIVPKISA